jgi:hypothetical protein
MWMHEPMCMMLTCFKMILFISLRLPASLLENLQGGQASGTSAGDAKGSGVLLGRCASSFDVLLDVDASPSRVKTCCELLAETAGEIGERLDTHAAFSRVGNSYALSSLRTSEDT